MHASRRLPALAAALFFAPLLCAAAPVPVARAASPAQAAAAAPTQEVVEVRGRIVAGMDQVFIKDGDAYWLVEGLALAPLAGRTVAARGLVIGSGREYRTIRLLEHSVQSPDDESPCAAPERKARAGQTRGARK